MILFEIGCCYVAQAGLELMVFWTQFQNIGIASVHRHTQLGCVCVHVCIMEARGRLFLSCCLPWFSFISETRSPIGLGSLIRLGWLASESQGFSCICFPSPGVPGVSNLPGFLFCFVFVGSEDHIQVFMASCITNTTN